MLYILKIHRIEFEIHPNFPEIRPIRLGPNFFFSKRIPKPWYQLNAGLVVVVVTAEAHRPALL
jgi:hypothetical protein